MSILSYKDLDVWKKSMDLVDEIYIVTKQFPKSETYALASQMQRAAVAIASNIAEGSRRNHTTEFIQFLGIANALAAELETQVLISKRQYKEFSYEKIEMILLEVLKMLRGLISSLKNRTTH
jgi:four helix bundle protein